MNVTQFSVKRYMAVLVLAVCILITGSYSYRALPRESFPDVKFPFIMVHTMLTGANPTDIETSVTVPLETDLEGTEGLKEMRSTSSEGMSLITCEFYPDVDTQVALQRVRDAVDQAKGDLPADADEPIVQELSFSDEPVIIYQLVGTETISTSELKSLAEKIQDKFEAVAGVLECELIGGRDEEILLEIDPDRLHFFDLPLSQVRQIVQGSNRNVSAGAVDLVSNRIVMRVPGEFETPGDLMGLVIGFSQAGTPIYLRDVAVAQYSFDEETSRSRSYDFSDPENDEKPTNRYVAPEKSIALHVKKRSGDNILRIAEELVQILDETSLPPGVKVLKSLDQSKDVNMMVSDLENGIGTSLVLVVLVILVGMGGRNAILVALSIPFSMLLSIFIIYLMGETLNMMVLFSLILSLGMLVDNAIVIVENIYRHYCLGATRVDAAINGTAEVAWPVIASTATTVGAFFPLVFWPGIVGEFMSFLPRTVIIVLLCSLFVALVINPTLASLLMRRREGVITADPSTQRPNYWAVRQFQKVLEFMLQRPYWTLGSAVTLLVFVFTAYGVFGKGSEFFPTIDPQFMTVSIKPPDGTSLDRSDQLARAAEDRLFGAPGSGFEDDGPLQNLRYASVRVNLAGSTGGIFGGAAPVTVNLQFVDRDYRTESTLATLDEARNRIEGRDQQGNVVTHPLFGAEYIADRPQEGPPTGKPISIEIFGEDLNEMTAVINDMKAIMANTPGVAKPTDDASTAQPTLEWEVDRARAGMFGLEQATIGSIIEMSVGGLRMGTIGHGDDEQDIILQIPEAYRQDTDRLRNVNIPTMIGGSVPLTSVSSAALVPGPVSINHFETRRVLTASADVQSGIKADALIRAKFQEQARAYPFPASVTYRFGGAAEEEAAAQKFLGEAFVIALLTILLILVTQFNSIWLVGIVMTSVVLAQSGVWTGLLILQQPFSIIMGGIAVISLAGVAVNNAIVLLDAIRLFEARGQRTYDAVVTATMIRFRPVVLTAITTILGLMPMALKLNFDFREFAFQTDTDSSQWWQAMATALVFGLSVATLLTLGVVPSLYLVYRRYFFRVCKLFGIQAQAAPTGVAETAAAIGEASP